MGIKVISKSFTEPIISRKKVEKDHRTLREILLSKGYTIVDEFGCKGYNTNSILKYIGGMNKNRPNSEDIKNAENFARNLLQHL